MPDNDLTAILKDFRKYRPHKHNEWLSYVEEKSKANEVRKFALECSNSSVLYLANLD